MDTFTIRAPSLSIARVARGGFELIWHVAPSLAYFVLMSRLFKHWDMFWIYFDEGYNLIKAALVLRGFHLYTEIWSDQPPLLTYLLASLIRFFGNNVHAGRLMVLVFASVLFWTVMQYVRLAWGKPHAIAAALLLPFLPDFIALSASVLVGLPSIVLASTSLLALAGWHKYRRPSFLVLSGIHMGASLLTKLFTAFLVPILFGGIIAGEYFVTRERKNWRKMLAPGLHWAIPVLVVILIGMLPSLSLDCLRQLVGTHIWAAQAVESLPEPIDFPITYYLRDSIFLFMMSAVGVIYTFRKRKWLMLYPLAWMVFAFIALLFVKPVREHHQMLVTIPAAMLAGVAIGEAAQGVVKIFRKPELRIDTILGFILVAGLCSGFMLMRSATTLAMFRMPGTPPSKLRYRFEDRAVDIIEERAGQTNWMFTDAPMYAFRANLAVPPELAVISRKRIIAGEISEERIIAIVDEYRPEQIMLARFEFPILRAYLEEEYTIILEKADQTALYLRNDLAQLPYPQQVGLRVSEVYRH